MCLCYDRRANTRRNYIIEQGTGHIPSSATIHHITDLMSTNDAASDADSFISYKPTDPNLRDSPALVHLQRCILKVTSQAIESGSSLSLVQTRLSQHQKQFDAFLATVDGLFRSSDADLTTAMRSDNGGAASFDAGKEENTETVSHLRRNKRSLNIKKPIEDMTAAEIASAQWREKLKQHLRTALATHKAAPSHLGNAHPDTSQSRPGIPDHTSNHTQAVAAQQNLSDEDWRAAQFGNWLEGLPKLPDSIEHQLAQSSNIAHGDANLRDNKPNDPDRRSTPANEVDGNFFDPPSINYPVSEPLPTFTRLEFDINDRDDFESWAAQKRDEFRRDLDRRANGGPQPEDQ